MILRTRQELNLISNPTSNAERPATIGSGDLGSGPVGIHATILDAFARTPNKTQWTFPVRLERGAKTLDGNIDHDPETLYNQLFNWSDGQAQELTLKSVIPWMDNDPATSANYTVVIEPAPMAYDIWDETNSFVDGHIVITLRQT